LGPTVQADLKVLITPTFSNLCNFGPEKDRQNSQNHVDRFLEDVVISFWTFLAYLSQFLNNEGFKKLERFTHYRPAMSFGNRKKYFSGFSQFSIVTI